MPNSPTIADGIKTLLINAAVGVDGATSPSVDWAIHVSRMPDKPDNIIIVRETGGKAPNPRYNIDFPTAQVRVRGHTYVEVRQKIREVKDTLLGLPSQDLNGDRWTAINMISDIIDMGWDALNRNTWVVNFALIYEPSSAGNRSI